MGAVKDLATELITGVQKYGPGPIIQRDLKGVKPKLLRKLVYYFYHNDKAVDTRTQDRLYLWKLVSWAILERSKILKDYQIEPLLRHRKALIQQGPAAPEATLTPSPVFGKQRLRRRERKTAMAVKSKNLLKSKTKEEAVSKKTEKGGLKFGGHAFKETHKFKLKENAEHSKNFKKRGPRRTAALLFAKAMTQEAAIEAAKKAFAAEGVKSSKLQHTAEDNVQHALNRLARFNMLEGQEGPSFPAPKADKKAEKKTAKVTKKSKAVVADEEDEDEEEEETRTKKVAKKVVKKSKAKVEEPDDDDEDEDEDEEDEDEEEDDE